MFDPLLDRLRVEVSGERALESVRALATFHRVQASPGYDEAAAWVASRLESFGLAPEIEHVPGDGRTRRLGALMPEGWACERAHATLVDGTTRERLCDYDRVPLSLILRSAPAHGSFPLVALADGTEDVHYDGIDVRGRVVLTAGAVHRVHELAVVERGAAGLLFDGRRLLPPVRGPLDDPDAVSYTSFWWRGDQPRGWGFVVSPAVGRRLRERLRAGGPLSLEVAIESRRFATTIPLLSTRIPGTGDGEILLVAHLCHPRPSANDNASGAAAALEAARALSRLRDGGTPARSVRILWVPELTGTHAWFDDPARAARTVSALNLDMVGQDQERCGSTFLIEHPPCFAASFAEELIRRIRARAQDWVTSYSGPGHFSLARLGEVPYSGGSDHAVLVDPTIGVPCPMLIQWPDRYYHSSHDTPDKSDPDSLALAARCAATYAAFLAHAGREEQAWIANAVGRGARRRLIAALDDDDPSRAVAAERLRARTALASLARLGGNTDAGAIERLEAFEHAEIDPSAPAPPAAAVSGPVPTRDRGPLEYQRHLIDGHAALTREQREALRRFEADVPGGGITLEVAWQACDGCRTTGAIAHRVWLETGQRAPDQVARFFEWSARLGVSRWRDGREEA